MEEGRTSAGNNVVVRSSGNNFITLIIAILGIAASWGAMTFRMKHVETQCAYLQQQMDDFQTEQICNAEIRGKLSERLTASESELDHISTRFEYVVDVINIQNDRTMGYLSLIWDMVYDQDFPTATYYPLQTGE